MLHLVSRTRCAMRRMFSTNSSQFSGQRKWKAEPEMSGKASDWCMCVCVCVCVCVCGCLCVCVCVCLCLCILHGHIFSRVWRCLHCVIFSNEFWEKRHHANSLLRSKVKKKKKKSMLTQSWSVGWSVVAIRSLHDQSVPDPGYHTFLRKRSYRT